MFPAFRLCTQMTLSLGITWHGENYRSSRSQEKSSLRQSKPERWRWAGRRTAAALCTKRQSRLSLQVSRTNHGACGSNDVHGGKHEAPFPWPGRFQESRLAFQPVWWWKMELLWPFLAVVIYMYVFTYLWETILGRLFNYNSLIIF